MTAVARFASTGASSSLPCGWWITSSFMNSFISVIAVTGEITGRPSGGHAGLRAAARGLAAAESESNLVTVTEQAETIGSAVFSFAALIH